jgi:hypothetical protein
VCGFALVLANFILDNLDKTADTNKSLKPYYRLLPQFNFGEGLLNLSINYLADQFQGGQTSSWKWEVAGMSITYMFLESLFFATVTLFIDMGIFGRIYDLGMSALKLLGRRSNLPHEVAVPVSVIDIDEAILKEKGRVDNQEPSLTGDLVLVKDLLKVYPARGNDREKIAVNHLSFGIPSSQIFGFLGVNGAGTNSLSIYIYI